MTDAVVRVTRSLKADAEDVFDAWTNADRLQQWLCPDPGIVAEATCDPVVGGRYRIVKIFESGADTVTGEYLIVDRPHLLVFTWAADSTHGRTTRVTVTLRPEGATTEMTITHEQLPGGDFRERATVIWSSIADKLAALLTP
ncbi:SRPBCC family protein [Streptacidiphilus rugosus]|uniref:SRPBCC family protein n=1 Tax=Streptacidiphilus rugosus TaxID=405783 RepID=UPI0006918729|nr:SRPBCC domain-containing protein [Streptacidiphilus rugosus]